MHKVNQSSIYKRRELKYRAKVKCDDFQLWLWHTEIPGLWTQELDVGLWTLDSGR